MKMSVELLVRGEDILGECPLWDERAQRLYWVDSRAPAVRSVTPGQATVASVALQEVVGSIAFRDRGGLLAATRSGIHFLDPATGGLSPAARPEAHLPDNRFNDGRCDRNGRFWVGSMSDVRRDPVGSLYRLDPDLRCTPLCNGIIIPNSLCWSPDGRTMYFADTNRHAIRAWDYDPATGAATRERVFVETGTGRPDGACVDAEGCLWSAEYGAARLVRYTPGGTPDRVLEVPVDNPTCCCFGGARMDELYITSARQRLTPAQLAAKPLAGSVLVARPGVGGLPEGRFAG